MSIGIILSLMAVILSGCAWLINRSRVNGLLFAVMTLQCLAWMVPPVWKLVLSASALVCSLLTLRSVIRRRPAA